MQKQVLPSAGSGSTATRSRIVGRTTAGTCSRIGEGGHEASRGVEDSAGDFFFLLNKPIVVCCFCLG